jgi:hypothetical protein
MILKSMYLNLNSLACLLKGPIYRSKIHSEKTFVTPASLINYGMGKLVMNLSSVHVCALFLMIWTNPVGGFVPHQSSPYVIIPKQNLKWKYIFCSE